MTRIILDNLEQTEITTILSIGDIEGNFRGCGYCIVPDVKDYDNKTVYMLTPKIIKYMVGDIR